MSRSWAKASAVSELACLACAVLCPPVLSRSSLHLVVFSSAMISKWGHETSIGRLHVRRLMFPAHGLFIFVTLLIMSDFVHLFDPNVGPSVLACDVEHTSFRIGLRSRNVFCAVCFCCFSVKYGTSCQCARWVVGKHECDMLFDRFMHAK